MQELKLRERLHDATPLRNVTRSPYDRPLPPARRATERIIALSPANITAPRAHHLAGRLRAPLVIAMALVATTALAGCGSTHASGTSADPASAIPASAALYAGATVRPQGSQQAAALAAGKALTHQADPYLRLLGALQTPGSPKLSFKSDVAPWLGPHAGVFLASLGSTGSLTSLLEQGLLGGSSSTSAFPFNAKGVQGAIVMDTTDTAKASSFLDSQAKHAGAHSSSYHGVSYEISSTGVAFGLVDRFAVIGSEAAMHEVIETTHGGSSLAASSGYSKLLASAPTNALAHIYSNPASSAPAAAQPGLLSGVVGLLAGAREANISLVPSAGSLALDADTLSSTAAGTSSAGLLSADPQSAKVLGELPGESWLAIGLGNLGANLTQDIQGLRGLTSLASSGQEGPSASPLSLQSLIEGMIAPLDVLGAESAQARHAFASWMGSAGVFASGGNLLELKAAIVIESKDPALSRAAVNELGSALRKAGGVVQPASIAGTEAAVGVRLSGLPVILDVADGRDSSGAAKFVLGFGEASVKDALAPPNELSASAPHTAAAASIGEGTQPSIMLDFPTLLTLLEGVGLTEAPPLSKFVPYLRSLTTLSGGGHELGGGVERFRVVLGLQSGEG
jgi:hypothetical protein